MNNAAMYSTINDTYQTNHKLIEIGKREVNGKSSTRFIFKRTAVPYGQQLNVQFQSPEAYFVKQRRRKWMLSLVIKRAFGPRQQSPGIKLSYYSCIARLIWVFHPHYLFSVISNHFVILSYLSLEIVRLYNICKSWKKVGSYRRIKVYVISVRC